MKGRLRAIGLNPAKLRRCQTNKQWPKSGRVRSMLPQVEPTPGQSRPNSCPHSVDTEVNLAEVGQTSVSLVQFGRIREQKLETSGKVLSISSQVWSNCPPASARSRAARPACVCTQEHLAAVDHLNLTPFTIPLRTETPPIKTPPVRLRRQVLAVSANAPDLPLVLECRLPSHSIHIHCPNCRH